MAMLLSLLIPTVLVAPAQAADNTAITVSDLVLKKTDTAGVEQSGQMTAGSSTGTLTFTWDANDATVSAGDSFSIALPAELNYRVPTTYEWYGDVTGDGEHIGTCTITSTVMTCTFNDTVPALQTGGYINLKGTGSVQVLAVKATNSETVQITINGTETVDVDLPAEGGIIAQTASYVSQTLNKGATGISENSTGVTWVTTFNPTSISAEYAKSGSSMTVDGSTVSTITFTDTLGSGLSFPDASKFILTILNSAGHPERIGTTLDTGADGSTTTTYGEFTITATSLGQNADGLEQVRIDVTGPWAADTNYQVTYTTPATSESGKTVAGFSYQNAISIDDTDVTSTMTRTYVDSVTVTVSMDLGYGTFSLAKYIAGPGADQVASDSTYTVQIDYTLPNGMTASDYPAWVPPTDSLNADRTGGTTTMTVKLGKTTLFLGPKPPVTFPMGTVITLTETSSPDAPDGYTWSDAVFKVGSTATNTLTIGNQTTTVASLTNNLVKVPTGTFSVTKSVTGVDTDQEFSFAYTCTDGTEGSLTAKADGVAVSGPQVPTGTSCTITEDVSTAQVDGYTLTAPEAQTVTIDTKDQVVAASFTNSYALKTGTFSVSKDVAGDGDFAANSYTFSYTCTGGITGETSGTLTVPGDGTAVTSPALAAGSTCTVTEDTTGAQHTGYTLTSSDAQSVTVVEGQDTAVKATNTYDRDEGTFSVSKIVTGDYTPAADETFTVNYTCDDADATSGTLAVPASGDTVSGPQVPTGTSCTITEDASSAQREGYSVATSYSDPSVVITKDAAAKVGVTNDYTALTGSFTVAKTAEGDGAVLLDDDATVTMLYTCNTLAGDTVSDKVTVPVGQSVTVNDVAVGSCTLREDTAVVGNTSLATTYTLNGQTVEGDKVSFDVRDDSTQAVAVGVTNTYTLDRGTFSVAKTVEGDDASTLSQGSYTFDYTCTTVEGERAGSISVTGDGTAVASGVDLPVGSTCTVSENTASAERTGYDLTAPAAQTVTIADKDTTAPLSFTNTYTRHTGTFSVTKSVTGVDTDQEFSFAYTCTDGTEGSLTAKADGVAVSGPQVPTGTSCTVTEDVSTAQVDGYTLTAPEAQTVTIDTKDQVVDVAVTNAYTPVPAPEPSVSPTPTASDSASPLAHTGADIGAIVLAMIAVAGGAVLLIGRRKA